MPAKKQIKTDKPLTLPPILRNGDVCRTRIGGRVILLKTLAQSSQRLGCMMGEDETFRWYASGMLVGGEGKPHNYDIVEVVGNVFMLPWKNTYTRPIEFPLLPSAAETYAKGVHAISETILAEVQLRATDLNTSLAKLLADVRRSNGTGGTDAD